MFLTRADAIGPTRKYSSVQNLTCDGPSDGINYSHCAPRISQPPGVESGQSGHHRTASAGITRRGKEENGEVHDLRQQVRMLNCELRCLRKEFTGSMQQLHTIQEGPIRRQKLISRVEEKDEEEFKPPLPPRLYRPAKPQRTFAHGSTSVLNLSMDSPDGLGSVASLANCSFRSDTRPPPPPRLRNSRSVIDNSYISQLPPLPPKPSSTNANRNSVSAVNGSPVGMGRERLSWQNRPAQIQTNGSISANGPIKSPPHYQRRQGLPIAQLGPLTNASKGKQKKLDLDGVEQLSECGGDVRTVENVVKNLENGFERGVCWHELGPVLLFLNPYNDVASSLNLANLKEASAPLKKLADHVCSEFYENESSQAVVFHGDRGSGKSYLSTQLLKALFHRFCYQGASSSCLAENAVYKQFCSITTILRSLTSVRRKQQNYSSQAAYLYELHIVNGHLYKTKTYCSFLGLNRFHSLSQVDTGFQIFYQLMAGLSTEEKIKFHLNSLNYAGQCDKTQQISDKMLFDQFRSSLTTLGIPFSDIMRVMGAVLLMANLRFIEGNGETEELTVDGNKDLQSASALLGLTTRTLFKALTSERSHMRGESSQIPCSAVTANRTVSSLSSALYQRCIGAIIGRANSLASSAITSSNPIRPIRTKHGRHARPESGISSSDESSVHDSGIGMVTTPQSNCIRLNTSSSRNSSQGMDGVITVLDWFGFSDEPENHFEQLCSNFAAEKLQNIYEDYIFKRNRDLAAREGINFDLEWRQFADKEDPVLISSSMIDIFQLIRSKCDEEDGKEDTVEGIKNVTIQSTPNSSSSTFLVHHYGDMEISYEYDSINDNKNHLHQDLIDIFSPETCNFGFASYLFSSDQRTIENLSNVSNTQTQNVPLEPDTRHFCRDFSLQTNSLLQSIGNSKIHFVHCVKPNTGIEYLKFDREQVVKQCKRLDVLPTVRLLSAGLPYTMKLEGFIWRYRFLIGKYQRNGVRTTPHVTAAEQAQVILECYLKAVDDSDLPYVYNHWRIGTKRVFLSDGAKRQLEQLGSEHINRAASVIQKRVRHWLAKQHAPISTRSTSGTSGANASGPSQRKEVSTTVESIKPPQLPGGREYTVYMGKKINFPQRRLFVQNYKDSSTGHCFHQNDVVTVIGCGPKKNQLLIRDSRQADGRVFIVPADSTKLCLN